MVVALSFALLAGSVLPAVENPWPQQIGLDFPFTVSGAFIAVAELRLAGTARRRRERGIYLASLWGLALGAGLYSLALAGQVL